jgi:hypothetical protein
MSDNNKERKRARDTEWQQNHRARMSELVRLRRQDLQDKFFEMYGSKCACPGCNETNRAFLTLDHINNDGYLIRCKYGESKKYGNFNTYKEAIKEYRPDKYQTLCFSCNCGKNKNGGICPHIKIQVSLDASTLRQQKRFEAFLSMYGQKCNCPGCTESSKSFLTLDHVQNDGHKERQNLNRWDICRAATDHYCPEKYQVLCFNCNCGKNKNKGVCPHLGIQQSRLVRNRRRNKFTLEQVKEIRRIYIHGSHTYGASALAKKYGVWRCTVEDIVFNKTWKEDYNSL